MPEVFEHSKIYFEESGLRKEHVLLLSDLKEEMGVNFITFGYDFISTNQYVGVVQAGDLILEILPKADKVDLNQQSPSVTEGKRWRKALLQMLALCYDLNISTHQDANISLEDNTLIDILFLYFLSEVEMVLQKYKVKKYIKESSNLRYLKGKLQFSKQIQKNLIHPERFYTEHETYTENNPYNQILKFTLHLIYNVSMNLSIRNKSKLLLIYFENISLKAYSSSDVLNLPIKRNAIHYSSAFRLAELILKDTSPDIRQGNTKAFGMLFDMNQLFEMTVSRMFKKQESNFRTFGLSVKNQLSQRFWRSKTIRPDIMLHFSMYDKRVIIDTKWKIPQNKEPNDADIKQIYVYNLEFNAEIGILMYPSVDANSDNESPSLFPFNLNPKIPKHCLGTYFVNIFDDQGNLTDSGITRFIEELVKSENFRFPELVA